jgi:hypothetical protein
MFVARLPHQVESYDLKATLRQELFCKLFVKLADNISKELLALGTTGWWHDAVHTQVFDHLSVVVKRMN